MNFKKLVIEGKKYGDRADISEEEMKNKFPATRNVDFRDSRLLKDLSNPKVQDFLRVIYLCHDIIVNKTSDGHMNYNSSSPDEIALINFAKLGGKELLQDEGQFTKIYDRDTKSTLKFQKLAFLEFNSDRKRMSVLVKLPSGQYELLTKGADSIIEKLLAPGQQSLKATNQHLE